ncbi:fungal-specific transcription factor domain-containing protein [Rhexocercosporidium sp. MPI-PUGE-AT-0058]|nr:fungal-specific transcription factor domain-containing protein [Rhexocercosporidium sp. MPI-PUGE-AT-0058]
MSDPLPPPRKRVSQACQPCGLKKVKCDGTYPTCTPCQYKQIDCTYGISKRRLVWFGWRGVMHLMPYPTRDNDIELVAKSQGLGLAWQRMICSHIYAITNNFQSRARTSIGDSPRPRPPPPTYSSRDDQPHKPAVLSPYTVLDNQTTRMPPRPAASAVRNVSPELSSRLLQTYFNCLHPLWPMLYKPLYTSLDYASPADMMHPALVAAIFCIASCVDSPTQHTPNAIVQKYPEPRQFLQEALDILQQGSDGNKEPQMINALTPSITACQVLTILCLQQHGVAEYAQAAVLCSLAAAMAVDLRLHRLDESGDPIQVEVKSRLWWNLYTLDKMISSDMGKPVLLRAEETDCPYPSVSEADEFELMSAQAGGGQRNSGQFRNTSIKLRTLSGFHSTIELSKTFERVSREIYGIEARKAIRENQVAGQAKRMELWAVFQEWESQMEASPLRLDLSNDLTSVPASVTNYVINWHGTILLHRPFIARWSLNPASADSPNPLDVCLEAANNICTVLEKYIDRLLGLPCDMVFSVFTAASTLLYHTKMSKEPTSETNRRLKLCIHWLSILGRSWKSAGTRHQMLTDMFDLPQELQVPNNSKPRTLRSPTPEGSQGQRYLSGTTTPAPAPISNGIHSSTMEQIPQMPTEDWGFLRDFGDASDEFFAFDVELRGLLDGGYGLDNINNYAG